MDFTLRLGGSKARTEPSGRADGGSIGVLTTLPGNSLTLRFRPSQGEGEFSFASFASHGSAGRRASKGGFLRRFFRSFLKRIQWLEIFFSYR